MGLQDHDMSLKFCFPSFLYRTLIFITGKIWSLKTIILKFQLFFPFGPCVCLLA